MSISSTSSILIRKVNVASLVLSSYLAQFGVNVLLIDENTRLIKEEEELIFDDYASSFLNTLGINITSKAKLVDIFKQAKEILLKNMCTISWGTTVVKNEGLENVKLRDLHNNIVYHQTDKFIDAKELEINKNTSITIKNIALLAWKLEGVLNGYISRSIFINHNIEERLLREHYQEKPTLKIFRNIFGKKDIKFNLKESKISLHLSQQRNIEAGDLLPNLSVFDERLKQGTNFYNWCKFGEIHLIILGSISQQNLFNVAKWVKSNFPLRFFYLPDSEKNEHIFNFFKIIEGEKKLIVVRPDRYIGLILDHLDLEVLDNYLSNFLQLKTKGKPINQKLIGSNIIENYP